MTHEIKHLDLFNDTKLCDPLKHVFTLVSRRSFKVAVHTPWVLRPSMSFARICSACRSSNFASSSSAFSDCSSSLSLSSSPLVLNFFSGLGCTGASLSLLWSWVRARFWEWEWSSWSSSSLPKAALRFAPAMIVGDRRREVDASNTVYHVVL